MLLLLLTVFPFARSPSAAGASARRQPPPGHTSRRGHEMSGHCRRLRSAWTAGRRIGKHDRAPGGGRRRTRCGLQGSRPRPHRASRPRWSAGPYGSSGRLARAHWVPGTLHRPDDARKICLLSASARSTLRRGSRGGSSTQSPRGRLMFLEPSGIVAPSPSLARHALATGPLTAPAPVKGNGRSAMPSIGAGASRLNRPARPAQVAARLQRARQPEVGP